MQRYFAKEKKENDFILPEADLYHIRTVMRMNDGDFIEVVYQEEVYLCCLENVNNSLAIHIEEKVPTAKEKMPKIVLIIPFLKEQKMDFIFQKGTELGVSEFIIIPMERSIIRLEEKKEVTKLERWSRICKEASEQCMRIDVPIVRIEKERSSLEFLSGRKLLCSTIEKEKTIKNILKNTNICDTINLMIGPEGGLSKEEEIYFEKKGFTKINLGKNIMRVETVPIFLASIIRYEYME